MKPVVWILVLLLVASNAFWAWWTFEREEPSAADATVLRATTEPVTAPEPRLEGRAEAREAPIRPPPPEQSPEEARERDRRRRVEQEAARQKRERQIAALGRAEEVKASILQIRDVRERHDGLERLAAILVERDAVAVRQALRVFFDIKNIEYDRDRFRELVLPLIGSEDRGVRSTALYALYHVKREPDDRARVIAAVRAAPADERSAVGHAMLMYSGMRAEGEVAELFVEFLASEDVRAAINAANALRGAWVTPELEQAVVDLWRSSRGGSGAGNMIYVICQVRPKREPLAGALLEELTLRDGHGLHSMVHQALGRELSKEAGPFAAREAARLLPTTTSPRTQTTFLTLLHRHGTAAQADVVLDLAANELVDSKVRAEAAKLGRELARRR